MVLKQNNTLKHNEHGKYKNSLYTLFSFKIFFDRYVNRITMMKNLEINQV